MIRFLAAGAALFPALAAAQLVDVTVTVRNLAPTNSISFAPTRLGFHNGTFDSFNNNTAAGPAIVSVAEGGVADVWFAQFAAAEPQAVLGSVGGALLPGASASNTFRVDASVNRFFTFGNMVIPSNDLFLGNDSPTRFQLLDATGNLLINQISQTAAAIWDANSEIADPSAAAFVMGGNNGLRTPENGLVAFDFSELAAFNGLTTAAGYTFSNAGLLGTSPIFALEFSVTAVPEPGSLALLAAAAGGFAWFRRRRAVPAPQ